VIGVGLIGGSIGLAARRRLGAHVVGYDADAQVLRQARELGAIERSADSLAGAVGQADYAFVATPVGHTVEVVRAALAAAGDECVVSDVGSTKRHIRREISDVRFVPGHPLAGAETAGVGGAREDLFDDALWYLAPVADAEVAGVVDVAPALAQITALIEQIGAQPVLIAAEAHDRLMASVSHLPHVLANILVAQAMRAAPAAVGEPSASVGFSTGALPGIETVGANPSFRDATRVAGANTAIWTDIYMSNADMLAEALDEAIRELSGVRDALDAEDADALVAWNERAREESERLTRAPTAEAGHDRNARRPATPSEPAGPVEDS
jgi:prephenate dehydrogenase